MTLDADSIDLPGHKEALLRARGMVTTGRLPQVIIFEGRRGLGKAKFVDLVVGAMFCEKLPPCGACNHCQAVFHHNHPEILYLGDEGKPLGVADADAIQEHVSVCAASRQRNDQRSEARVVIVNHAETLNHSATNRLLKILEEPPEGSYIFLITNQYERLLETLRSRAIRWPLKPPSVADSLAWLRREVDAAAELSQDDLREALRRSGYAPLAALERLGSSDELLAQLIEMFTSKQLSRRLALAESIGKSKDISVRDIFETLELAWNELHCGGRDGTSTRQAQPLPYEVMASCRQRLAELRPFAAGPSSSLNKQLLLETLAARA